MLKNQSFKAKILAIIFITTVICFGVTITFIYFMTSSLVKNMAYKEAEKTGTAYGLEFENTVDVAFRSTKDLEQVFRGLKTIGMTDRNAVNIILKNFIESNPKYIGAYTVWESNAFDGKDNQYINKDNSYDSSGRLVPYWNRTSGTVKADVASGYDKQETDWYNIPKTTGAPALINPYIDDVAGNKVVMISIVNPIMIDGKFAGITGIDFALNDLQKAIAQIKPYDTGYASVISNNGVYAANIDSTKLGKDIGDSDNMKKAKEAIQTGQVFSFTEYENNDIYYKVFVPVSFSEIKTPWSFMIAVPMSKVVANCNEIRNYAILIGLIAILISCGIFYALIGKKLKPLTGVTNSMQELAKGNFQINEITVSSHDEIGQLGSAANEMAKNLRHMMKQVSNAAENLAASSEQLTASSEQSAQVSNQVASSITDVAEGASKQLIAANETYSFVEQMSASIQQVAVNTNQMTSHSIQAVDKAKDGGKVVEKAVNQMIHVGKTVHASAQVVTKLGERSKEIGEIIDTISGIAGQTNLLALNAAIEAARAGEQGKGFAVVAEEVRKLAEQSQDAAEKIAELILEIQSDTDKAVVAMTDGTHEVNVGADMVNAAGVTFHDIVGIITEVSEQVKEISAAIQHLASGSQQIVGSVKTIDELSKMSSDEAQSVAAATEEQLASMDEIASSSRALSVLAQDLQVLVSNFKI